MAGGVVDDDGPEGIYRDVDRNVEFVGRRAVILGRRDIEVDGVLVGIETCAYRKSSASILVMQSTQDRTAQNASRCLGGS